LAEKGQTGRRPIMHHAHASRDDPALKCVRRHALSRNVPAVAPAASKVLAPMKPTDAIVLGAGIVGVSLACHLQRTGRQVTLVDRREPGEETSFGNAGVVEIDGFTPTAVPRNPLVLMRYGLNLETAAHFHYRFLPRVVPWLVRLLAASGPRGVARYAAAIAPLEQRAADEHRALARWAKAEPFFRDTGWLHLFRSEASFAASDDERCYADELGARYEVLTPDGVAALEPDLRPVFHKAIFWSGSTSVSDPSAVTKAYAAQFVADGGTFVHGDARTLRRDAGEWHVDTEAGAVAAPHAVVALGPWSMDVVGPLGYAFPFAVKRGYHRHFTASGEARLARPVVDLDHGYVITPMARGIRLTTGIEFADRDAPATPVQLTRLEPVARSLFPLGEPAEEGFWKGARPCLPDSLPILGPAPRHEGLWFSFGHGHLGLTLGPVTGRLLAAMIAGEPPLTDPRPYAPERFLA